MANYEKVIIMKEKTSLLMWFEIFLILLIILSLTTCFTKKKEEPISSPENLWEVYYRINDPEDPNSGYYYQVPAGCEIYVNGHLKFKITTGPKPAWCPDGALNLKPNHKD